MKRLELKFLISNHLFKAAIPFFHLILQVVAVKGCRPGLLLI